MFPPSLKKNIRELDRQISLLENECEHLGSEKNENHPSGKTNTKAVIGESPNKPFVTGPCASANTYTSRLSALSPIVPKIYSASCAHFRTISEKFPEDKTLEPVPNKYCYNNSKFVKKSDEVNREENRKEYLPSRGTQEEKVSENFEENKAFEFHHKTNTTRNKDTTKSWKRSISSIKEVSESSDENVFLPDSTYYSKAKKHLSEASKDSNGNSLKEKISTEELQIKNKKSTQRSEINKQITDQNQFKPKTSSDEERSKGPCSDGGESKSMSEKYSNEHQRPLTPRRRTLNKRRLRSARTKKNYSNEVVLDLNFTKILQEKEIQCMIGNEEKSKTELFTNLCDSLRSLYVLTGEAQTKSSREKINEVLNDMKNNLTRINNLSLVTQEKNALNIIDYIKGNTLKSFEGEELSQLKKTLYGVAKFCQEIASEKSALTEELLEKTEALAKFKAKEKEYQSLIANFKFALKKMRQEVEEKAFVVSDFEILKTKLQEETKVIEALKKSHEKMQELVENYVLENDKLKAKVKISQLETEKFHVLLTEKEEEINKYKKDRELFQRQITAQLSLLRSKTTENEIVDALKAISDQTNSLQTEMDSNFSETTVEKENFKTLVHLKPLQNFETTSLSSMESKKKKSTKTDCFEGEESPKKLIFNREKPREEKNIKEIETCPTCKPTDSDSETNSGRRQGLQRVLSSSKNLRSSINELLEDIRRETSEKQWSNAACDESTSLSTIITTSSEVPSVNSNRNKKLK